NAAVLIDADGNLVPGRLPDGRQVPAYRKTHLSNAVIDGVMSHEKYYSRPGPGFPVFQLGEVKLGILICYDRSFPEAWRELTLNGAEMVVVVSATPGWRERMFLAELSVHAYEQEVFVVATNKGGVEWTGERERHYFGRSCIVAPTGETIAEGPAREGPVIVCAPIDIGDVERTRRFLQIYRDRRPDLYTHLGTP
ncbi:MAG: carbon-nitrogen hydrolase family protein, partial [Chloroflexi bacterium]|nr:carbon-nitrogen hydrolase family protein [Chloroflexota bacterium]